MWQVLLAADNPGIWLAHCHDLAHATYGMVLHLAYEGVSHPSPSAGQTALSKERSDAGRREVGGRRRPHLVVERVVPAGFHLYVHV